MSHTDSSLAGSDVTSCVDDVIPSPWQRDADDMLMTTLKPAVIPTVVESERVTEEDEWSGVDILQLHQPLPPAAAATHQRCTDTYTDIDCHRPLTFLQQGKR